MYAMSDIISSHYLLSSLLYRSLYNIAPLMSDIISSLKLLFYLLSYMK